MGNKLPNGYWTKERCLNESLKFKTKIDFMNNSNSAYVISYNNKWLDDICSHMDINRKPKGFWTKEKCAEEALKYKKIGDLKRNESRAYRIIVKNKWYEELCNHMELKRNPVGYWNFEACKKSALKYKTKTDFIKNDQVAYETAIKNKWIDDACSHMIIQGNILKRCIYALEFTDNHAYIGLSYNAEKRFEEHTNDVSYNTGNILKYIKITGLFPKMKILTDYINYEESSIMEEIKKQEYIKNGWIILNKNKCGGLGRNIIKWNKEKCIEAALNCKTISELLHKYGGGVYGSIRKNGWHEEIKNILKNKNEN